MVSPINKNTVKCEHKLDLSCIYVKKKEKKHDMKKYTLKCNIASKIKYIYNHIIIYALMHHE